MLVLQQIRWKACTRKPNQIKSPISAKEFCYILRQSLQTNSELDSFSKP